LIFIYRVIVLVTLAIALTFPAVAQDDEPTDIPIGPTLAAVQARGQVICGINDNLFGFGFLNPNTGNITGIYVDFCRAITTAVLGDPAAVDLRLQAYGTPPTPLLDGELDVLLVQHLTQTLSQDTIPGLAFGAPVFYDGQTVMVRLESGIESWENLDGQTICVQQDSLAQDNFVAEMARRGLSYDLLALASPLEMHEAFLVGRCSAQTNDRSLLEIRRSSTDDPFSYAVWNEPFTRVPIAPIYRYDDEQWANIVNWTLWGLIHAEALGITSETIDTLVREQDENDEAYLLRVGAPTARLLDPTFGIGSRLGLTNDFMVTVIRQVGNYGEIYERSLGPSSALPVERSINALWLDNGLIAAPEWR
jgi:general L-amino acid transport system substrate-binding protein